MSDADTTLTANPAIHPALTVNDGADSGDPLAAGKPMSKGVEFLVSIYLLGMFIAIVYLLIKLWPGVGDSLTTDFLWGPVTLPLDVRLFLIAAVAGALGAYVHLATSFADYAGNQQLTASWIWWYVFRPFIGMALAEIVYLAIRGGFFNTGGATSANISPYGVAAITALTGLFSKQATDKLREVFETLFRTQRKVERKDALPTVGPPAPPGAPPGGLAKSQNA